MGKILIAYSPDGKNTATKIHNSLKQAGFSVVLGNSRIDDDKNSLPSVVVAIISSEAINNAQLTKMLDSCNEHQINVIPFVTSKLDDSVTTNFYLDEHVWIDNIQSPINESIDDLVDCLKINFDILSQKAIKKSETIKKNNKNNAKSQQKVNNTKQTTQSSNKEHLYKNLLYLFGAVIVVMLFLLINGGVSQNNREADNQQANVTNSKGGNSNVQIRLSQSLKKSEQALLGRWAMSDYSDNQYRASKTDSIALEGMINALIKRAQLVFSSDKTFQRIGFSEQVQTGSWEYDPQSRYLKLQPTGINQYDVVQIQEVNENKLIIVVSENVENNKIITRMVFDKIANQ